MLLTLFFLIYKNSTWSLSVTYIVCSNGSKHLCVLVPRQQWVLATPRLGVLNVCPSFHEVLVTRHERQFTSNGPVNVLNHIKVGWEENIKVALVDLSVVWFD